MNLISPVESIQQIAISCPQRVVSWHEAGFLARFFLCRKAKVLFFKKAKALLICLPNTISGLQALNLVFPKANQIMLLYWAYRNIYRQNANLQTQDRIEAQKHRGIFLNSKGIPKTYLFFMYLIFNGIYITMQIRKHISIIQYWFL